MHMHVLLLMCHAPTAAPTTAPTPAQQLPPTLALTNAPTNALMTLGLLVAGRMRM